MGFLDVRRALAGLVLLAAAIGADATDAALADAPPDACGSEDCLAFDDLALLQRHTQDRRMDWPDLNKLAKEASAEAKKMLDQAKDAAGDVANDLVATALVSVGETVNGTLMTLQLRVDDFAERMNDTAASVRVGVASLLSRAFQVPVPGLQATEADRAQVRRVLDDAGGLLNTTMTALTQASLVVSKLPAGLGNVGDTVKTSLQVVLTNCQNLTASVQQVRSMLESSMPAAPQAALLQLTDQPTASVARINEALRSAKQQLASFTGSLDGGFQSMADGLTKAMQGKVSVESLSDVSTTYDSVAATAKDFADQAAGAYGGLLSSVGDGVRLTGILPDAAPSLRPCHTWWLLVAALAAGVGRA